MEMIAQVSFIIFTKIQASTYRGMQDNKQSLEKLIIIPNNNWSNVKPGDLLFFGKENKITHVGMSTGGKEFIHQGGMVRVNSLDSSSNKFAPKRNETFQFIKRLN